MGGLWQNLVDDESPDEVMQYWLSPHGRMPTTAELVDMSSAVDQVFAHEADRVATKHADVVADLQQHGVPDRVIELVLEGTIDVIGQAAAIAIEAGFKTVDEVRNEEGL